MSPNTTVPAPSKDGRYWIHVPAYYWFMWRIEAWLKGDSLAKSGGSLFCAKLMEHESKRDAMLTLLADQMGISKEQLIKGILAEAIAPNLTQNESATLED